MSDSNDNNSNDIDIDRHPSGDPAANTPDPASALDDDSDPKTFQLPAIDPSAPAEPAPQSDQPDAQFAPDPLNFGQHVAVVRLSGAEDGEATVVTSGKVIIGRIADDLNVMLPQDQWASRRHAEIIYRDGGWWIEDLNSSNGVLIDRAPIPVKTPTPLRLGQVFRIGHTDLMLSDDPGLLSDGAILV